MFFVILKHDYSQEQSAELQESAELHESIVNINDTLLEDNSIDVHNEEHINNNNNEESQIYISSSPNNIITQPFLEETNVSRSLPLTNLSNINASSLPSSSSVLSSAQSLSNIYDVSQAPSTVRNRNKRKCRNEDVYVEAIESIAQSLKTPLSTPVITTPVITSNSTDTIDTCMSFIGSLLKKIQSKELQLDVMNTLVQTVINANVTDLERAKRN